MNSKNTPGHLGASSAVGGQYATSYGSSPSSETGNLSGTSYVSCNLTGSGNLSGSGESFWY